MSHKQGALSATTLEEALAEIEGLKEQLSGSDLKVFTQNRELRQENVRLREEVTRLTEECVTQTFAVRGLEKTKAALEKQVAEKAAIIATLESQVAEWESRAQDLTEQLGVHRSQEIHLSQELERTISSNAEELSRLKAEHDRDLETTRQNLEQARAEIEKELQDKLAVKAAEVQGLEQRVEQFKEEFLSQEFVVAPTTAAPGQEGRAFRLLREKMEDLLGFPGRTLVEQVFRHCGADENTSDPTLLEETFEALQDTAGKLVRSPEQEQELSALLKTAWQDLGLGSAERPLVSGQESAAASDQPAPTTPEVASSQAPEPDTEASARASESPAEAALVEPEAALVEPEAGSAQSEAASVDQAIVEASEPQGEMEPQEAAVADVAETPSQEPAVEEVAIDDAVAGAAPDMEEVPAVESVPETEEVTVSPVTVDPETRLAQEVSEEPVEPSMADSETVTEEDLPPVAEPNEPQPNPILDSIDAALAEPSVEDAPSQAAESEASSDSVDGSAEPTQDTPAEELSEDAPDPADHNDEPSASESSPEEAPAAEEPVGETAPAVETSSAAAPAETSLEQEQETNDLVASVTSEPESTEATAQEPDAPDAGEAIEAESGEEDGEFDAAAAALANGDFATACPIFSRLREAAPSEPAYLVGEIASLAGLERYEQAYALGKGVDPSALDDSAEVYRESFETVLLALAEQAESLLARKLYLIELVEFIDDSERITPYLDEIEEIGLRTPREGELNLLQARHRVGQDDVTEYLIEAMGGVCDNLEVFDLLRQNLDRYPELTSLAEFMERLLGASRDEALEAESSAKELIGSGEPVEELLEEPDPSEELVKVFLEHMLPRTGLKIELPSEQFEDLLNESEPAAFVGALRQALRSVDYTMFFEEIDVLSYDGDEHFLLRSSPEPKATLLFGSEVDDVPPEELRFLVLRELFSMVRRHSHLAHMAAQLDDRLRYTFVKACLEIHKEAEFQIPESLLAELDELEGMANDEGQDSEFRTQLESGLMALYQATESDAFPELGDFLFDGQLHKKYLDPLADSFAAKQTGLVVASFAIARDTLSSEDFETLEESGFQWLYEEENLEKFRELRFRLQRLWAMPLKALVSESEE